MIAAAAAFGRLKLSRMRTAAASAANAAAVTLLVCLGLPGWYFLGLLLAGGIAFAGKGREEFLRGLFFLLLAGVCFGGILEALTGMLGLPLMAGTVLAVLLLRFAGRILTRQKALRDNLVTVRLQWEERTETLCGMIDTGNRLKEPLTGRPVSIVDAAPALRLLGETWEERRGFYLIPYHSIGTGKGWLRAVTIDCMTVELSEGTAVIKRPILAIYDGKVSAGGAFQLILHPMHAQAGK